MKRRIAIIVLRIDIVFSLYLVRPSEEVIYGDLWTREASPVKWSRHLRVSLIYGHFVIRFEKGEWESFIALCCQVKHVDALLVLPFHISSMLDQEFYSFRIPHEWSVVQCSEALILSLWGEVDPLLNNSWNSSRNFLFISQPFLHLLQITQVLGKLLFEEGKEERDDGVRVIEGRHLQDTFSWIIVQVYHLETRSKLHRTE